MAGSGGAVRGASLLILLQIASRAITFVANQLLLRFMTAQLLGISTQLEVYYLSVLFFARESLRVAIQRQDGPADSATRKGSKDARAAQSQAAVNIAYISITLGLFVAAALGWMYLASVSRETVASAPNLAPSLYIYALAAMVELLSEPAFVVLQIRLQFGARATAESVATVGKCAATLSSALWAARAGVDLGVLPFALGQLTYGLGLLAVYAWHGLSLAGVEGFSLLPKRLSSASPPNATGKKRSAGDYALSYFYRPTLSLASSMMAQSIVKQILTQGDTLLVSTLSTPTAQGVYALANNYGGLAARLVFQPIEESSRSYFSRVLSQATLTASNDESLSKEKTDKLTESAASSSAALQASSDLRALLRLYILMGLIVTAVGSTAAPIGLSLIAGPKWSSTGAGSALAAYIWYIPLLAINGVTEAFVSSVATETQVHRQSVWMTAFSLAFGVAGFVFLRVMDLGAIGLVLANGINMGCRIIWAERFISGYFRRSGASWDMKELLPSPLSVLAAAVTSQAIPRATSSNHVADPAAKLLIFDLAKIAAITVPFVAVL